MEEKNTKPYWKFAIMIVISFIIMYVVMFLNVDEFSDRHLVRAYLVAQQSHATIDSVAPKPPGGGEREKTRLRP